MANRLGLAFNSRITVSCFVFNFDFQFPFIHSLDDELPSVECDRSSRFRLFIAIDLFMLQQCVPSVVAS